MKKYNKYHIIRAVNYSIMHLDELRKEAIEKRVTIGEVYYEELKQKEDENNNEKNNSRT
jgi:hypothetical protein